MAPIATDWKPSKDEEQPLLATSGESGELIKATAITVSEDLKESDDENEDSPQEEDAPEDEHEEDALDPEDKDEDDEDDEDDEEEIVPPESDWDEAVMQVKLSAPLLLGVLSDQINMSVDNAFLGNISTDALTASQLAVGWISIFTIGINVPAGALEVLAGQATGAKNKDQASVVLARCLVVMAALFPIVLVGVSLMSWYSHETGADAHVVSMSQMYVLFRMWGLAAYSIFMLLGAFVQSTEQDTLPIGIAAGVSVLLNVPFNYVFIHFFGFIGSPMATALAEVLTLVSFLAYLHCFKNDVLKRMFAGFKYDLVFQCNGFKTVGLAFLPQFATYMVDAGMMPVTNTAIYKLLPNPVDQVAAQGIMFSLMGLATGAQSAVSSAICTRASIAITHTDDAEKNKAWCLRSWRVGTILLTLVTLPLVLLLSVDGDSAAGIFSSDPALVSLASTMMVAVCFNLVGSAYQLAFIEIITACGYFVLSSVIETGLMGLGLAVGVVGVFVVERSVVSLAWGETIATWAVLPISFGIFYCIDWEECTKVALERANEDDEEEDDEHGVLDALTSSCFATEP